jgi:hypothetical protein
MSKGIGRKSAAFVFSLPEFGLIEHLGLLLRGGGCLNAGLAAVRFLRLSREIW